MRKTIIKTDGAPTAIGPYSQAVKINGAADTVYISGQIPIDPKTGQIVDGNFALQANQVFKNLSAIAQASGGSLDDAVKLTVYVTDLAHFAELNDVMANYCREPYPARAAVEVSALPKGALVEIEAILLISHH